MKFLLYAQVDEGSIGQQLGTADYSYFFLLRAFAKVLGDLGEVITLQSIADADRFYSRFKKRGERCVLLSFAPPHKTPLHLACPVVPVFAWEYPQIPEHIEEESWKDDPRNDWRNVFARTGRAITLSNHTVAAVQRSMGPTYPVVAIPSPINSRISAKDILPTPSVEGHTWLKLYAGAVDSYCMGLDPNGISHPDNQDGTPFDANDSVMLPSPNQTIPTHDDIGSNIDQSTVAEEQESNVESILPCDWNVPSPTHFSLRLPGIVYTCVVTPEVGRKNWEDLITAFCWTFANTENVTLVLKLTGKNLYPSHLQLLMLLTKLSPFKCRVIAIYGYISDSDYAALIGATTYYVNTSLCEGLCLPLVEFLSSGVPAIAPNNTAMADYICDQLAFVVKSYPGVPTMWPHGDYQVNRTSCHQLSWESLAQAYRDSYQVVLREPSRYRQMSTYAANAMQRYCGADTVRRSLHAFLCPEVPLSTSDTPLRSHGNNSIREHAP